jgi:hypothetical protein
VGRQLGATIGVAVFVSVLGDGVHLASFSSAWTIVAWVGPVSGVALLLLPAEAGRRRSVALPHSLKRQARASGLG